MLRVQRIATALVLATAVFMMPLALDMCAATCALHDATSHAGEPTCHHTTGVAHLAAPRMPCGHDHHLSAPDGSVPQPARALTSPVALTPNALLVNAALVHSTAERRFDLPPLESPSLHLSVSLRI